MSLSSILTRKCAACMCADSRAERPLRHEATEISIYKTTSHETHCVTGRPKSQEKTPLKHLRWLLLLLLLSHTRSKSLASRGNNLFPTTLVFGSPFLLALSTPDSIVGKLVFPRASATRIRIIVVIVVIIVPTPPPQVF